MNSYEWKWIYMNLCEFITRSYEFIIMLMIKYPPSPYLQSSFDNCIDLYSSNGFQKQGFTSNRPARQV
jgi:hypothetical protein